MWKGSQVLHLGDIHARQNACRPPLLRGPVKTALSNSYPGSSERALTSLSLVTLNGYHPCLRMNNSPTPKTWASDSSGCQHTKTDLLVRNERCQASPLWCQFSDITSNVNGCTVICDGASIRLPLWHVKMQAFNIIGRGRSPPSRWSLFAAWLIYGTLEEEWKLTEPPHQVRPSSGPSKQRREFIKRLETF